MPFYKHVRIKMDISFIYFNLIKLPINLFRNRHPIRQSIRSNQSELANFDFDEPNADAGAQHQHQHQRSGLRRDVTFCD